MSRKRNKWTWSMAIILGAFMLISQMLLPVYAKESIEASAVATDVSYIDENGQTTTVSSATIVDENTTTLSGGWYVVNGDVSMVSSITVTGEVHLILADNCRFMANKGIQVEKNSLSIYAQSEGENIGLLMAKGERNCAGIGGGGNVIICGGMITAVGGSEGAGIGGGGNTAVGKILIYGGTVTAIGDGLGSGIGCGSGPGAGVVGISGGNITATGGRYGAGIGGNNGSSGIIKISGGTVTATGGNFGIGFGDGEIEISGGKVDVNGSIGWSNDNFSTGTNGSAIISAKSIFDHRNMDAWTGIIKETDDKAITVGGEQILNENYTVEEDYRMDIMHGSTLTVPKDVTLTDNGKINGTLHIYGRIAGKGEVDPKLSLNKSDLVYSMPEDDLPYDSMPRQADVDFKDNINRDGAGKVTVLYWDVASDTTTTDAPINAGSYSVSVTIEEGSMYRMMEERLGGFRIRQADQKASSKPTIMSHDATTITLNMIEDNPDSGAKAEYSKDNGLNWQDSPIFAGLNGNDTYTFAARYKATDNYYASDSSETLITKILHNYTGRITKEATCMEAGIMTHICTCGDSYTTEIAINPNNHKVATEWSQENDKHYHVCKNGCGVHIDEAACSGGTATYTERAICEVCGMPYGELMSEEPETPVAPGEEYTGEEPVEEELIKTVKAGKNYNKIYWDKVKGADGYYIYAAPCNEKGKRRALKLVKDITFGKTTSFKHKGLKKATWYKYRVVAYKITDDKRVTIARSFVLHSVTNGGKYVNPSSVKVNKSKVTLKKGKTFTVKAKVVVAKRKKTRYHGEKIHFISSNTRIATVNSKGKIRAKKKGRCTIYAIAQNGVSKKVKVTVK